MDSRFDGLTALTSIAAGKAADLVVLAGNRAKNIDDVERVETVRQASSFGSRGLSPNPSLQRTRAGCSGSADSSVFGGRRSPLNGKPLDDPGMYRPRHARIFVSDGQLRLAQAGGALDMD